MSQDPPDGSLVLLLHGSPQSRHTWRDVLPELAALGWRAVAVDQRGSSPGVRPPSVDDYSTERLVGDVLDLADALGGERVHVVGHDWGGQVARLTAAHHPERISGLSVLSRPHPAAFARSFDLDPEQATRSGHHRAMDGEMTDRWHADDSRQLRAVLSAAGVAPAAVDAYLEILGERAALDAAMGDGHRNCDRRPRERAHLNEGSFNSPSASCVILSNWRRSVRSARSSPARSVGDSGSRRRASLAT